MDRARPAAKAQSVSSFFFLSALLLVALANSIFSSQRYHEAWFRLIVNFEVLCLIVTSLKAIIFFTVPGLDEAGGIH